jgi:hypothetical protein
LQVNATDVEFQLQDGADPVVLSTLTGDVTKNKADINVRVQREADITDEVANCASAVNTLAGAAASHIDSSSITDSARGFIETLVFFNANDPENATPQEASESTKVYGLAYGLTPFPASHPLAYRCVFTWGASSQHSRRTRATVTSEGTPSKNTQTIECSVPIPTSTELEDAKYTMSLSQVTNAGGAKIALVTQLDSAVKPTHAFIAHGPQITTAFEVYLHKTDLEDSSSEDAEIPLSIFDMDTPIEKLAVDFNVKTGTDVLRKSEGMTLTGTGREWILKIPLSAMLKYGDSLVTITVTDSLLHDTPVTATLEIAVTIVEINKAYASCTMASESGKTENGLYKIRGDDGVVVNTYCDFQVDGGGWQLVASVHEDDIGIYSAKDVWMDNGDKDASTWLRTWETDSTFGTAEEATKDDFKSKLYASKSAANVMICT